MKTNFILTINKAFLSFLVVVLWATSSLNAQCPTVNSNPSPICNGEGYNFGELTTALISSGVITDNGGGVRWYTQPNGGVPKNNNELVQETTYFLSDSSNGCALRPTIFISFQVPLPTNPLTDNYCSNDNATIQTYIDRILQKHITDNIPGGSVSVYYVDVQNNRIGLANSNDPIGLGLVLYDIVYSDINGCTSQIKQGSTGNFISPDKPTPILNQPFCASVTNPPTVANLHKGTNNNVYWYTAVNSEFVPVATSLQNPTDLLVSGKYYVQAYVGNCKSAAVEVTVTVSDRYRPGTPRPLNYCFDSLPSSSINLFDSLDGPKDANGTWTGPLSTSGGHLGTVNISTLTTPGQYTFTYSVPANGECLADQANVVITIHDKLSAGEPLPDPAQFCISEITPGQTYTLGNLLTNADPGGVWTENTPTGGALSNDTLDLSLLSVGNYSFKYTQNGGANPCSDDSKDVVVKIVAAPNAGAPARQDVCENRLVTNYDLFKTINGQDNNNGTWRDASNNEVPNPSQLDITGYTVAGSPYNFTYTIDNGVCNPATVSTSITIKPAPESGFPNIVAPLCENAPELLGYNLFTLINSNSTTSGTWYIGSGTSGTVISDPTSVDLTVLGTGTLNFTYAVPSIDNCPDDPVVVQIVVNPKPNSGIPINPAPICVNDLSGSSNLDLFGSLGGNPTAGGLWAGINGSEAYLLPDNKTVNISALPPVAGTYNFSYTVTDAITSCTSTSIVQVTVVATPNPGTVVDSPKVFCEVNAIGTFDLGDLLQGEGPGVWFDGSNMQLTSSTVDVAQLAATNPGVTQTFNFTFDVDKIGTNCDSDIKPNVQIIITPSPKVGAPNIPKEYCESELSKSPALNLFDLLDNEDELFGKWYNNDTGVELSSNMLNVSSLTVGTHQYIYTINGGPNCILSSLPVSVVVKQSPESGTPKPTQVFCKSTITAGQTFKLIDLLSGNVTPGVWSEVNSVGALNVDTVSLDGLPVGIYSFVYNVDPLLNGCDDDDQTVKIAIIDAPNTGIAKQNVEPICINDLAANSPFNLHTLLDGSEVMGGTWYNEANNPLTNEMLDITNLSIGDYKFTYTIDGGTSGCPAQSTEVTLSIVGVPDSGNPVVGREICLTVPGQTLDLFELLTGENQNGKWYLGLDTSATGTEVTNPIDISGMTPGLKTYTYNVTNVGICDDADVAVSFEILPRPNTGTPIPVNLCESDLATTAPIDLMSKLLGVVDPLGKWTDDDNSQALTVTGPVAELDVSSLTPRTYRFTYTVTDAKLCTSSSTVVVTVYPAANAGDSPTVPEHICIRSGLTDLFPLLGPNAQSVRGTWTFNSTPHSGIIDPTFDLPGTYTYTVLPDPLGPCTDSDSASVVVEIDDNLAPVVVNDKPELCLVNNPLVSDLNNFITFTGTVKWYEDAALQIGIADPTTVALVDGEDYYATQVNASNCESSISTSAITVKFIDAPTPTLSATSQACISSPKISELESIINYDKSLYDLVWYDSATDGSVITKLTSGSTYYASLTNKISGCGSSVRLPYKPVLCIVLPEGFSPNNGDDKNNVFTVYDSSGKDILPETYPNYEIEVYNRNGNLVFKGDKDSPFSGVSNQGAIALKGDLPVGVYFYIFKFNDGVNEPKQGHLYLSR